MIGQIIVGIIAVMTAFVAGMLCWNTYIIEYGYKDEDIVEMSSEVLQKYNQKMIENERNN